MFGKKEISPAEMQELNSKSFKNTQEIFRRRLREIAADGEIKAKYKPGDYCMGDRVADWLKSLGFTVKQVGPAWCEVTWPKEEDIIERLRSEALKIMAQPVSEKVHYAIGWLNSEIGTWTRDLEAFDYVCSKCRKHAEFVSDYCPNCGKKMVMEEEGRKYGQN